jgi:hypothetical protein
MELGNEILSALVCWLQLVEIISEGTFLSNEKFSFPAGSLNL